MGIRSCAALYCSTNSKRNKDLSFFRFPKDPDREDIALKLSMKKLRPSCAAEGCCNKQEQQTSISYFRFPKDEDRCKRWVINCRRADYDKQEASYLHQNVVLCAEHFEDSQFTNSTLKNKLIWNAVPTIFPNIYKLPSMLEPKRSTPKELLTNCSENNCKEKLPEVKQSALEIEAPYQQKKLAPKSQKLKSHVLRLRVANCKLSKRLKIISWVKTSTTYKQRVPRPAPGTRKRHSEVKIVGDAKACTSSPGTTDSPKPLNPDTNNDYKPRSSLYKSNEEGRKIQNKKVMESKVDMETQKTVNKGFYQTVMSMDFLSDVKKKYYTGLPSTGVVTWLNNLICGCLKEHKEINPPDQLLLTLMKLRLGLSTADLAVRFGITKKLASVIVKNVILNMASKLKFLINLPSKKPASDRHEAREVDQAKATVMIDCLEFGIEEPVTISAKNQTWNDNKKCYTIKVLLCAAHCGLINFVSQCWGGSISNKELILRSGFFGEIEAGDVVIADRDFFISDDLDLLGAKFEIHSSESYASRRQGSDSVMIQAFEKIKNFKILSGSLPLSVLPYIDDAVICCAAFSNLQP